MWNPTGPRSDAIGGEPASGGLAPLIGAPFRMGPGHRITWTQSLGLLRIDPWAGAPH
jgi:hypothetical protein